MKVASYCRVSTDRDDQANSFESQQRYFKEYIDRQPDWELYQVYADEGITGTSTKKRAAFNRMIADAHMGKFQLILTKEVSRFSRNILDTISYTRELKALGVGVVFMNDGIYSLEPDAELRLSIMGSMAQEESRKTSSRVKWGQTRRMEQGVVFGRSLLGYDVKDGKMTINRSGAEIVRQIFYKYGMEKKGTSVIARELREAGYKTLSGNAKWSNTYIIKVLKNEKYVGDTLCQKTYKTGFPFVQKINRGEVDQFYVEGTHPAIVSQEVYDKAQALRQMKKKQSKGPDAVYPLSRKMCCGICGFTIYRRVTRRGTGAWSCGRHLRSAANCPTGPILEEDIYAAFLRMYNKLRLHDGIILRPALGQMEALETAVQRDNPAMLEVNKAIAQATERGYKISKLRANGLLDADACAAQMAANTAQLTQLRAKRRRLLKNDDIGEAAEALRQTVDAIRQGPERLERFDEALFEELVEQVVVSPTALRFRLYGGIEVTERIREDAK